MAFRLEEFKKTTRKGAADAPAALYPHQIKDKKVLSRLEIAIRHFDGSVGRRRRDLDAQAMVDFFGDPRLARGIVACLTRFYRFETPDFPQMVGREAASRLTDAGLNGAREVRALTYAVVNDKHHGFLTEADRAACYGELGARFCLTAQQWDVLLHLDAEENQLLTRLGAVPKPVDIVALYNFHSLETTLRRATQVLLAGLVLTPTDAADIRALGRALGVKAVVSGDKVTLSFPEATEANMLLPRRTVGLSRCLLHLVEAYATRATLGSVETVLAGRKFRFLLSTDALKVLGMSIKPSEEKPHFKRRFEAAQTLHKELLKLRAKGEGRSWKLKRLPEPMVAAGSVTLPDFTLTRGGTVLPIWTHKKLAAADVLAQAEASAQDLFAVPEQVLPAVPGDVRALCDRAAAEGMVRTAEARRILHLLDESPLIEWIRQAADPRVRYIPGVGLCSSDMITAIHGEPPINTARNA